MCVSVIISLSYFTMLIISSIILNIIQVSKLLSLSHYPVVNILAIHFLYIIFQKSKNGSCFPFPFSLILFYEIIINFAEVELVEQGKASTQLFN